MTRPCGCCAACAPAAARRARNRPGLSRIETRIGTHSSFFDAMVAGLSAGSGNRLEDLRTRSLDDPSIALIDAWALVADVLAFYQERIANEAYLRTATERRSLVEIARLVGYRPRPGVAAAAHLAFTLENESEPAEIPKGTRVNSVPGPGEKMVAFETSEAIRARREWNAIRPRLARPQTREALNPKGPGLYLKGTKTRLKVNDPLLVQAGAEPPRLEFIHSIAEDHDADRTLVRLAPPPTLTARGLARVAAAASGPGERSVHGIPAVLLSRSAAVPPASAADLARSLDASFSSRSDVLPRLLGAVQPALGKTLYQALRNAPSAPGPAIRVHALRVDARPFGHNAPRKLISVERGGAPVTAEWPLTASGNDATNSPGAVKDEQPGHGPRTLYLDNDYDVAPGSMVVILRKDREPIILGTEKERDKEKMKLSRLSLSAYGMSGKSVLVEWDEGPDGGKTPVWLEERDDLGAARKARVLTGMEALELADAPIGEVVSGSRIELDGVYEGLEPGRWLIVEGERADIVDTALRPVPGVRAAELAMLLGVEQSSAPFDPPPGAADPATGAAGAPRDAMGEKLRTILTLSAQTNGEAGLAYRYKRDSVTIHANVARATHGETRAEILGSGDASASLQTFLLKQPPLTHVPAATPSGTASTLEVRVNDLLWREAPSLAALGPADRAYLTRDDEEGVTRIVFGNGVRGARPPSGRENVRALYRSGIGRAGNVAAGRLSLLATRPLGVKGVANPLRASGGADREDMASIRSNAPVALMALDRLVSAPDYADFARAFGGVGKAAARRKARQDVAIVVAGVADAALEGSALLGNLAAAMRRFGDPQVALTVEARERLVLVIQANVRVDPDRDWAIVEPRIRAALLEELGFEKIAIGEGLAPARALRAIQAVDGVTYADIDLFDALSEESIYAGFRRDLGGELKLKDPLRVEPHQIAYLAPDVPETLILQELTS